jgi:ribose 5-phosphate isomerase RpiB
METGICVGFTLKEWVHPFLADRNYEAVDCRACKQEDQDNHPDLVIP